MLSQRISSGCWKERYNNGFAAASADEAHVSFVYMLYHMDVIGVPKEETFFSAIAAVEATTTTTDGRREKKKGFHTNITVVRDIRGFRLGKIFPIS